MDWSVFITIVCAIIGLIGSGASYYFYVKAKINEATADVINKAEDSDKVKEEKMALAITEIKKLLPKGATVIFNDAALEKIIQKAFDKIEEYAQKQAQK